MLWRKADKGTNKKARFTSSPTSAGSPPSAWAEKSPRSSPRRQTTADRQDVEYRYGVSRLAEGAGSQAGVRTMSATPTKVRSRYLNLAPRSQKASQIGW